MEIMITGKLDYCTFFKLAYNNTCLGPTIYDLEEFVKDNKKGHAFIDSVDVSVMKNALEFMPTNTRVLVLSFHKQNVRDFELAVDDMAKEKQLDVVSKSFNSLGYGLFQKGVTVSKNLVFATAKDMTTAPKEWRFKIANAITELVGKVKLLFY
jgi:hypothetical protein